MMVEIFYKSWRGFFEKDIVYFIDALGDDHSDRVQA
jgi:succinate dehydrogenase flavin-adding protein (antitoxin of CptAB toxin-antitoxin module)